MSKLNKDLKEQIERIKTIKGKAGSGRLTINNMNFIIQSAERDMECGDDDTKQMWLEFLRNISI